MKKILSCAALVLAAACGGETVVLRPLPALADAESAAQVTVIRPRSTIAAEFPVYVVVGGQPVFDLRSGEHTRFAVAAGRQPFAIRCLGGPVSNPTETRIEHEFPPRGAVYFVVEPKFDCVTIEALDARAAASLLATTRFRAVGTVNTMAQATGEAPAVIGAAVAPQPAVAGAAVSPQERVAAATTAWVEAFNSRDAARLVALYDTEAVLWGTSAQRLAVGAAAIAEYFKSLNAPQRAPVMASIGEQRIRVYGDTAIDTGSYTFWVARDGKQEPVPARYSFVYLNRGGKWLIVDHHSSRLPAP